MKGRTFAETFKKVELRLKLISQEATNVECEVWLGRDSRVSNFGDEFITNCRQLFVLFDLLVDAALQARRLGLRLLQDGGKAGNLGILEKNILHFFIENDPANGSCLGLFINYTHKFWCLSDTLHMP